MKKLLIGLTFAGLTSVAIAQQYNHNHHNQQYNHHNHHNHNHHNNQHQQRQSSSDWAWAVPAIIGGAIIYGAIRSHDQPTITVPQRPYSSSPQSTSGCPFDSTPLYNRVIMLDGNNRRVETYQLVGCQQQ